MAAARKRWLAIGISAIVLITLATVTIRWIIPQNEFATFVSEHFVPGLIPSSAFVAKLDSKDKDDVLLGLSILHDRGDPAGVTKAIRLLQSKDDYIWFNAALYLGKCNRQEAVPYLIKGLRHGAYHADPETIAALQTLTGQTFGGNFKQWRTWWLGRNPGFTLDWNSHLGYGARASTTGPT